MASSNNSVSIQCTKIPRFSLQHSLYAVYTDIAQDGCRLAVSGYNHTTNDTFIDLFTLWPDPDSQDMSLLRTCQPYFSKEFTKIEVSRWRCVCLLDDSVFVTCCGDTIELYHTEHGRLFNQRKVTGEARCMTTRDGRVYVGLLNPNQGQDHDVVVFDLMLNRRDAITLKGLKAKMYPGDMTVSNNKLFVCTSGDPYGRALMYNSNGDIEQEYKTPHQQYRYAWSITVSEENGLIYILWRDGVGKCVVGVYSLLPSHSSLPGDNSSFSGGHLMASVTVSDDSCGIRINTNVNRLFVVTNETGEVYEYHTNNIINLENLLTLMELLIDKDDCQKLLNYFKVPADKAKTIIERDKPSKTLLQHLRETDNLFSGDISLLLTACNDLGITKVKEAWTNYQNFLSNQKQLPLNQLKESENQRKPQLTTKLAEYESDRQELTNRLKTTQQEKKELAEKFAAGEEQRLQELEETKSSLREAKNELVKAQMRYSKESMALREVLKQITEALNKQAITSTDFVEEEQKLPKTDTPEISQESTALAADYGRLMVDVAEDLTLDNTLQLAYFLQLPDSEKDMLRRISLIETPGLTLINFMKRRNIINMYDVTNLQRGLMYLHLYRTNTNYVVPYQQKVDPFQFEENRSPHLVDWPEEETEDSKANETFDHQESERAEKSKKPKNDCNEERLTEKKKRVEIPRPKEGSQAPHITQTYIEHKINYEGGTIALMGVYLSIPDEALSGDHVIAVTVIRDPDGYLPGSVQRGRMTPLIKLEPEGLKLNKPAQLTIPHSAIIPDPDRHSVIIFSGQQGESRKGQITWTEEKSLKWNLEQEKISLDINTLSYIFVNLVSHEKEQKYIFRVVPFIDGILDAKDDVLITVWFCKNSDAEYKVLLEDNRSKLTFGDHKTFQVSRALNAGSEAVSCLNLVMSSQGGSYHLCKGKAKQLVDIDHLFAASRISHHFRLKRSKDGDTDMVDVKLKVSQGDKNQIALILQSKIKNILLSPETQILLYGDKGRDVHEYENLKNTVSNQLNELDKHHCERLAVFFDLTPAEVDTIQKHADYGTILMKILDERELIMPDKMIGLYEGLKAHHLNKIGRHVLEYIDASQREKLMTSGVEEDEEGKKIQTDDKKSVPKVKKALKLSKNAALLIKEGHKGINVQRALKLSHGKLDLARRLLLIAKDEHERLPLFQGSTVYKERYMDQYGGEMHIAGVHLLVPAGALHTGRIVSLMVSADPAIKGPISNESLRVTPIVKFGPEDVTFHKHVTVIIPHCVFIKSEQKDKTMNWNLEWAQMSCLMNSHQLELKIQKPCLIDPHIPYHFKMRKRMCVLPIMNRLPSLKDESTICLWFYNDDKLESDRLINEEVYKLNAVEIHHPVSVHFKSMNSILHVSISSSTPQCSPYPKKVDVATNVLWLQNRHKVVFQLQNTGRREIVNLEIEAKVGMLKNLFRFRIQLKMKDLSHGNQITSPFQRILPESIIEAFKQLNEWLSEHLNADQCSQLANIFQLPEDVITSIENQRKPGKVLLDTLVKKSLISPANMSPLESALTEQGNEECAKLVRDFRKNNPVVEATMCQETNF